LVERFGAGLLIILFPDSTSEFAERKV
jgi:hypothetical protein